MTDKVASGALGADLGKVMDVDGNSIPIVLGQGLPPTLFVDAIRGLAVLEGLARFNLVEHRLNPVAEELQAVIRAQIIMPVGQVQAWADFFQRVASDLAAQTAQAAQTPTDAK